jgi:hypothetical protein
MSEMSQAQVPPGGDAGFDPSTEIVPPAARTSADPSQPDEDAELPADDTGAREQESAQDADKDHPEPILPTAEDHQLSRSEAPASSDPMPDMAGGAPPPEQ